MEKKSTRKDMRAHGHKDQLLKEVFLQKHTLFFFLI